MSTPPPARPTPDSAIDLLQQQRDHNGRIYLANGILFLVFLIALLVWPVQFLLSVVPEEAGILIILPFLVVAVVCLTLASILTSVVMRFFQSEEESFSSANPDTKYAFMVHLDQRLAGLIKGNPRPAKTAAGLVEQLQVMGFYKYAKAPVLPSVEPATLAASLYDPANMRFYPMTGAEFSNDSTVEFMHKVQPFLTREGVRLDSMTEEVTSEALLLNVSAASYVLYTLAEQEKDDQEVPLALRSFAIVNDLLNKAGSKERIYLANLAEHAFIAFLTESMYGLLLESSLIAQPEKPRSPERIVYLLSVRVPL